jgi:hypothetical protein
MKSEAEFSDEIQTKVLRVFPLDIYSHLNRFALRFIFSSKPRNLLQFLYTVKEKGGNLIENHTPFPMV